MEYIALRLITAVAVLSWGVASHVQAQSTSKPKTTAKPDTKFVFMTKSVELEGSSTEAHRYRVEGVTVNGWRFLINCSDFPPPGALNGTSTEEVSRKIEQYQDFKAFQKVVLEKVGWASLSPRGDRMVLYANVVSAQDVSRVQSGEENPEILRKPWDLVFADCPITNHIENGAEMLWVEVLSSQFRNWKNGTGYEITAGTGSESLRLGCTEGKGAVCMSLPPNIYRSTRSGSQVRLYDADLALIGAYRIVSENATPQQ